MTDFGKIAEELEGLAAKATCGEWRPQLASDSLNLTKVYNDEGSTITGSIRAHDAALISLCKNNLPAILSALRRASIQGDEGTVERVARGIYEFSPARLQGGLMLTWADLQKDEALNGPNPHMVKARNQARAAIAAMGGEHG